MLNYLSLTHLIYFVLKVFTARGYSHPRPGTASTDPDAPRRQPRALL